MFDNGILYTSNLSIWLLYIYNITGGEYSKEYSAPFSHTLYCTLLPHAPSYPSHRLFLLMYYSTLPASPPTAFALTVLYYPTLPAILSTDLSHLFYYPMLPAILPPNLLSSPPTTSSHLSPSPSPSHFTSHTNLTQFHPPATFLTYSLMPHS
jgi:hypothetical protein